MQWGINWVDEKGSGHTRVEVFQLHPLSNWIIGGFAMGLVQGTLHYNDETFAVYGLAELIV